MSVLDEMHLRRNPRLTLGQKLLSINWGLVLLIALLAGFGLAMLYSAANASFHPWASRQAMRFLFGLTVMLAVALIDIRVWFRLSYPIYLLSLLLLVAVELKGSVGMGAQRWIDLGVIQLQPSEVMKVALIMALARYFHGRTLEDVGRVHYLIPPLFLAVAPAALVLRQPDLGTALMLLMGGGALFFAAGVRWWKFALAIGAVGAAVPLAWNSLRGYQQKRVLTFFDPESDPLGAGYHIMQSKIALGSGGVLGKGYLQGSQSHLNFLPEKQTDFIFTMLAEELGMVGGLILLGLFFLVFVYGFAIALRSRNHYGRLLALGLTVNLFLYVFINI
ncbi:MAG: rod shape-determining protein RodA, partial [Tistlia sp.]